MRILLGPAGSPEKSTIEGVSKVKKLGLQAMEVQFTHGIKMSLELARQIGSVRKQEGTELSIHAPYYINLVSKEEKKIEDSKKRILDSCERGHEMGAEKIVFHPAYFGKFEKEFVANRVVDEIKEMQSFIKKKRWNVKLAPETTGKHSAFGSLDEIIWLAQKTKCSLCVDIAHLYARGNGKIDFHEVFEKLKKIKGHLHFHFSGIKYSAKGELSHLVLNGNPSFREFAEVLLDYKRDCTIISESPITWKDSLKMKKILEELGYGLK